MKTTGVILIALAMLIALTGVVIADQVVPAIPGAGGITSSKVIVTDGTVMTSSSLGWSLSGEDMYDFGLGEHGATLSGWGWDSMLDPTMVQYSTTYDANTIAKAGQTTIIKTLTVDTGNKLLTQSNVKATTEASFMATGDGGNILGVENIMVDGAGMPTAASDRMICPFGAAGDNVIPAYCNIVTAGSKYDLVIGSVVSTADNRFVGTDATVPVALNYGINVKPYTIVGQGTSPAMGSASSYYKVSIKEGRTGYWGNITDLAGDERLTETSEYPGRVQHHITLAPEGLVTGDGWQDDTWIPSWQQLHWDDVAFNMANEDMTGIEIGPQNEDVTYAESSSASGIINSFSTSYAYQSGKALLP